MSNIHSLPPFLSTRLFLSLGSAAHFCYVLFFDIATSTDSPLRLTLVFHACLIVCVPSVWSIRWADSLFSAGVFIVMVV